MKTFIWILSAGMTLSFLSCGDGDGKTIASDSDTSTNVSTTTPQPSDNGSDVDASVPATARTTFETKYPKASNVKWRKYQRQQGEEVEQADWNAKLDTSDYEVSFRFNDVDYMAWYDDGNWIRTATKVSDHASLPAAVTDAIKKEFAGFSIYDVDKEEHSDGVLYEIELKKGEEKWKAHFTPEGKVTKRVKKKNA